MADLYQNKHLFTYAIPVKNITNRLFPFNKKPQLAIVAVKNNLKNSLVP